ncbi:hypothetical protein L0U85_12495 [Glycomyces sp. L485]|uniref:hypothetical protein n=1 Tax=Glycomyces sp. L485 TaxID=2909235 RepID=UPI001F4B75EB|nr:hypothetical protein [Glycomyces sp. L485]MCH7231663.1 hypothetical protein [Glycomyces sp. L485]
MPDLFLPYGCVDKSEDDGKNEACERSEVGGRTVVTRTLQVGETHSYFVYLTASLPAPVYDPDAHPGD